MDFKIKYYSNKKCYVLVFLAVPSRYYPRNIEYFLINKCGFGSLDWSKSIYTDPRVIEAIDCIKEIQSIKLQYNYVGSEYSGILKETL